MQQNGRQAFADHFAASGVILSGFLTVFRTFEVISGRDKCDTATELTLGSLYHLYRSCPYSFGRVSEGGKKLCFFKSWQTQFETVKGKRWFFSQSLFSVNDPPWCGVVVGSWLYLPLAEYFWSIFLTMFLFISFEFAQLEQSCRHWILFFQKYRISKGVWEIPSIRGRRSICEDKQISQNLSALQRMLYFHFKTKTVFNALGDTQFTIFF